MVAGQGNRCWRVWSTYAYLTVERPGELPEAAAIARDLIGLVDRACSRFRADSDLRRVNAAPGRFVGVDPLLVAATRVAVEAAAQTDGLVDPCLGRPLVSLGYDADLGVLQARGPVVPRQASPTFDAWREIRWLDDALRIPPGVALDLGATAKAWTADLVATAVAEQLGCATVFSLGGDVRVAGADHVWPVRVTERPDDTLGETIELRSGGVATSTTLVRRWATTDGPRHHLLDPRTAEPVAGVVRTATTVGHTCVAANTASTAALVLGDQAASWLEERDVASRLVTADGSLVRTGAWRSAHAQGVA